MCSRITPLRCMYTFITQSAVCVSEGCVRLRRLCESQSAVCVFGELCAFRSTFSENTTLMLDPEGVCPTDAQTHAKPCIAPCLELLASDYAH